VVSEFTRPIGHAGQMKWRLADYSTLLNLKKTLESSEMEFRFGETVYKFQLSLRLEDESVECFLTNLGEADVAMEHRFNFFGRNDKIDGNYRAEADIFLREESVHIRSLDCFVKDGSTYVSNGSNFLKVVCDFRVIDPVIEVRREGGDSRRPISPSSFADAGAELFKSGLLHDFTVKCDEELFKCHKAILAARCKYFEAMFNTDTLETAQGPANVIKLVFVIYG
jgi:BTB/POZ domain